jgi:hypothetical protein
VYCASFQDSVFGSNLSNRCLDSLRIYALSALSSVTKYGTQKSSPFPPYSGWGFRILTRKLEIIVEAIHGFLSSSKNSEKRTQQKTRVTFSTLFQIHIMSSGSIEWLREGLPIGRSSSPGSQEFSLLHIVQTGSGVHTNPYLRGTAGSFTGSKMASQ